MCIRDRWREEIIQQWREEMERGNGEERVEYKLRGTLHEARLCVKRLVSGEAFLFLSKTE